MRKSAVILTFSALCLTSVLQADPAPVEDLGQPRELERPNYYDQDERTANVDVDNEAGNRRRIQAERYEQSDRDNWQERNNANVADTDNTELNTEQRLTRLEQQIENANKLNLMSRIEELQDELGQLRGQLDKQTHDLQMLAIQQKQFYQDLSARINQPQNNPQITAQNASQSENPPSTQTAPEISAQESELYREAFDLLKSKQYDQAIAAFQKYLVRYPSGHYSVNGNYWLGEIYYLQGKSLEAKKAFTSVVKNYQGSQKMPDALLKLAIIEIDAGNKAEGERILEQVQQQYPGTTAARLAALRYQELRLST